MANTGYISGAPAAVGNYSVTASVSDGVLTSTPQAFTWSVSAAPTPAPAPSTSDTSVPSIDIASPTTAATYASSASTLALSGSAGDNVGVVSVSWTNNRGGSGTTSRHDQLEDPVKDFDRTRRRERTSSRSLHATRLEPSPVKRSQSIYRATPVSHHSKRSDGRLLVTNACQVSRRRLVCRRFVGITVRSDGPRRKSVDAVAKGCKPPRAPSTL